MTSQALTRQLLLRIQNDCFARISSHSYFDDVAVILERKRQTAAEIAKQLGTLKGRSGKVGAAILVRRPLFFPLPGSPRGEGEILQTFTALEHPTINTSSIGTGKTSEEIAAELFMLFVGCSASVPTQVFSAVPEGTIVPDEDFDELNAWSTRMQTRGTLQRIERCGEVLITPDEGSAPQTITLSCGTSGASIYYTTDGTAPWSGNTAATLYSAPFALAAAATVRASAFKTGLQPSGISEATFT